MHPIPISDVIDSGPITAFQIAAIALSSLVAFLDGLDSQSIAVAAPVIAENLGLARSALGQIFSAGLLGAMIGALGFGPLGDQFGRKRVLILATLIFGVFTLATVLAQSFTYLLILRFAAGLGLGGATPCFIALASEYAPRRRRAMVASLIWAAFPLGGTIGGFLNGFLLAKFSWQVIFIVGGVLPLFVAAALALWLPESLRFVLSRGDAQEKVRAIVQRMRPELPAAASYVADEERLTGAPLKHLFTEGRAGETLLLWVPFIGAFGTLAIAVVWTPILLREHGVPPAAAGFVLGIHGIGALIGMGSAGRLMERFGVATVLVPALLIGAVATGSLGFAAGSIAQMSAAMALVGLTVGLGASGSIALASLTYPTAIRSSGVGWAMGMGRFGQVLAPLFAGAVTGAGWSGAELFLSLALAPFVAAIAIAVISGRKSDALPATTLAAPTSR